MEQVLKKKRETSHKGSSWGVERGIRNEGAGNLKEKSGTIKLKELVRKEKCELIVAKQRALEPGIPAI